MQFMTPVLPVPVWELQKRYLYREIEAEPELFDALDGLHFHTLCEQNADDLAKTLEAVEENFGPWLSKIKWLNMGGGHHITRDDYDRKLLIKCINTYKRHLWSGGISGAGRSHCIKCRLSGDRGNGYCGKRAV